MTLEERKNLLLNRIPSTEITPSDVEIDALLEMAKGIIFEIRFHFLDELPEDVETIYHTLQVQIALEIYAKTGAEGQISHSEAGVSRTYTSADISTALIGRIIPMCGV